MPYNNSYLRDSAARLWRGVAFWAGSGPARACLGPLLRSTSMRLSRAGSRPVAKLGVRRGHCRGLIEDDDVVVVFDDDDLIHVRC